MNKKNPIHLSLRPLYCKIQQETDHELWSSLSSQSKTLIWSHHELRFKDRHHTKTYHEQQLWTILKKMRKAAQRNPKVATPRTIYPRKSTRRRVRITKTYPVSKLEENPKRSRPIRKKITISSATATWKKASKKKKKTDRPLNKLLEE